MKRVLQVAVMYCYPAINNLYKATLRWLETPLNSSPRYALLHFSIRQHMALELEKKRVPSKREREIEWELRDRWASCS